MGMSRSDAIAVHGMGKNMFKNVEAIQSSTSFEQMSAVMLRMAEEKLHGNDEAYEAQSALQLRIRTFIENHNIR